MAIHKNQGLSIQQYNIWLEIQLNPKSSFKWNIINEKKIHAELNVQLLEIAWKNVLDRNKILTSKIINICGIPHQIYQEMSALEESFIFYDFSMLDEKNIKLQIDRVYRNESHVNSNLEKALTKFTVIKCPNQVTYFILRCHHILTDGKSFKYIWIELNDIYSTLFEQKTIKKKVPAQYSKFIAFQKLDLLNPNNPNKIFWSTKLNKPINPTNLPYDHYRISKRPSPGSIIVKLDAGKIKNFSTKQRSTSSSIILTAFYLLLYNYTGQEDIIIGTYFNGRQQKKYFEETIGMFVNAIPLRIDLNGETLIKDLIKQIFTIFKESNENQYISNQQLLELTSGVLEKKSLFSVAFNYSIEEQYNLFSSTESTTEIIRPAQYVDNDLTLRVYDYKSYFIFRLDFDNLKFRKDTIARFLDTLVHILTILPENLNIPFSSFNIIPAKERIKIKKISENKFKFKDISTIHTLIEQTSSKYPEKIAVVFENQYVTYKELNEKANYLSKILISSGVKKNSYVPVLIDHSLELVLSILAILKTGSIYVPVDPLWPVNRITKIISELSPTVILTNTREIYSKFLSDLIKVINVEYKSLLQYKKNSNLALSLSDPIYMFYTSGSTGTPKGAIVHHKGVLNRLLWMNSYFGIETSQSVILTTRFIYDSSIWQILWPLINGGKTVIMPTPKASSPIHLFQSIHDNEVKMIDFVPSLFGLMAQELYNDDKLQLQLSSITHIIIGGEEVNNNDVINFKRKNQEIKLFNLYGPTEASIGCIAYEITGKELDKIPIGKPISNVNVLIVDNNLKIKQIGAIGEILLGGTCVGLGYFGDPYKTRESFINLDTDEKEIFYRTGDFGRWNSFGNIEFFGRKDSQVKIRGHRIELGEVRYQILKYEKIENAVLKIFGEGPSKFMCAYIISSDKIQIKSLKDFLSKKLFASAIPRFIIQIDALPMNNAGKIDYFNLPLPNEIQKEEIFIPNLNPTQETLISIWSKILGIPTNNISVKSDFFDLGGHSINAIEVIFKIYKTFQVEIPIGIFFKHSTIEDIALLISKKPYDLPIKKIASGNLYPLSSNQSRIFVLHHMDSENLVYNMPSAFTITGILDVQRLESVLNKVIERYEILRTSFHFQGTGIVQKISKNFKFKIDFHLTDSKSLHNDIINSIKPFDLSKVGLVKIGLFKLSKLSHVMVMDIHHIISDGISLKILINEICSLYDGKIINEPNLQYKDYVEWENSAAKMTRNKKAAKYWLNIFKVPIIQTNLPQDYLRPKFQEYKGDSVYFTLPTEKFSKIINLSKEESTTPFVILLASINILISKLTDSDDIVIGVPVSGRIHPDLLPVVGLFANTIALRNRPYKMKRFVSFIKEVRTGVLNGFDNQEFALENLIKDLGITRDWSRNPLYDVLFSFQHEFIEELKPVAFQIERYSNENDIIKVSKVDLAFWCKQTSTELVIKVEYNASLYNNSTISKFISSWENILNQILKEKSILIKHIMF